MSYLMMRREHFTVRREDGFTLIEMLASMIFIGVLFAAFALVLSSTLRHNNEVTAESTAQTELRAAIDGLAAELRQAYSGDTTSPIASISGTQITFLSPDRASPFHLRRISYQLSSGNFQRAIAISTDTDGAPWNFPPLGAWATRVKSVVNATAFTYLDASGVATANPASVRTVSVALTVSTTTSQGRQFTYSTSVTLRTPV